MSSSRTPRLGAVLVGLALMAANRAALAQACCAGASTIMPGRLGLHERALLGLQTRVAWATGSYGANARYRANASGSSSLDLAQDLFGSVRILERAQVGALVSVLESWRRSSTTGGEFGGGFGDLNLNARYDLIWTRELSYFPGLGALLGVTLPTGRAPESASLPLGSDATGIGATQVNAGLALERDFGQLLVNLSGLVAWRTPRHVHGVESRLGAQLMGILGVSHPLLGDTVLAGVVTYAAEGDARIDGELVPGSGRRLLRVALGPSGGVSDSLRLGGTIFIEPPFDGVGKNQLASVGVSVSVVGSLL